MSSLVLPSHQIRRLLSTNSYDDGSKNSWEPFKSRSDFNLDMGLLLLFILCIIIGAFILNFCINRYLNQSDNHPSSSVEELKLQQIEKSAGPTIEFSSELNLSGTESVCPICLSEFINGEKIRVLSKCNHGFHVKCIEKWLLSSHTSCPTCRTNCMNTTSTENSGEVDSDHHRVDIETEPVAEVPMLSGERESTTTSVE